MDYVFPSRTNEPMLVPSNMQSNRENRDSSHEEVPFFGDHFPSPFLDDISTSNGWKTGVNEAMATASPSSSKVKRVRKKRSAGKKDRHSKIHTAQGLRDRRMRLSLHIARKFFGLQDMLGFDKASKTIEWLFSKSKKAIEEVTESVRSQNTNQSHVSRSNLERFDLESDHLYSESCDLDHENEINDSGNSNSNSKKLTEGELLAKESRDKARARARERTRERMKSKQMFEANPNDDFDQVLQLGFSANPNNHFLEESSSSQLEYSNTHHFFQQNTEDYMATTGATATATASSSSYFANPPAGWLNSSNTFLGFLGGWDSENFTESYGGLPSLGPSTGVLDHGQGLGSVIIPPNLVHFQAQNQRD